MSLQITSWSRVFEFMSGGGTIVSGSEGNIVQYVEVSSISFIGLQVLD